MFAYGRSKRRKPALCDGTGGRVSSAIRLRPSQIGVLPAGWRFYTIAYWVLSHFLGSAGPAYDRPELGAGRRPVVDLKGSHFERDIILLGCALVRSVSHELPSAQGDDGRTRSAIMARPRRSRLIRATPTSRQLKAATQSTTRTPECGRSSISTASSSGITAPSSERCDRRWGSNPSGPPPSPSPVLSSCT
jgi:hypothetical protein